MAALTCPGLLPSPVLPLAPNLLGLGAVGPTARRNTGLVQSSNRDECWGFTGTANRQCLPWEGALYLVPFIFLPPFEAAPSERLLRAASVTKTRPARRKKQLQDGKQIMCRGRRCFPIRGTPRATAAFAREGEKDVGGKAPVDSGAAPWG